MAKVNDSQLVTQLLLLEVELICIISFVLLEFFHALDNSEGDNFSSICELLNPISESISLSTASASLSALLCSIVISVPQTLQG